MTKCCFPGCEADSGNGGSVKGRPSIRFCEKHFNEFASAIGNITLQATVVSALAQAVSAGFESFDTALKTETRRLLGMQSRRIQYLKLAGFDRVDEGVE